MVAAGKGMLLDTALLKAMRGRGEIFKFDCPEYFELDVTSL
jgi:hypothetical protein